MPLCIATALHADAPAGSMGYPAELLAAAGLTPIMCFGLQASKQADCIHIDQIQDTSQRQPWLQAGRQVICPKHAYPTCQPWPTRARRRTTACTAPWPGPGTMPLPPSAGAVVSWRPRRSAGPGVLLLLLLVGHCDVWRHVHALGKRLGLCQESRRCREQPCCTTCFIASGSLTPVALQLSRV